MGVPLFLLTVVANNNKNNMTRINSKKSKFFIYLFFFFKEDTVSFIHFRPSVPHDNFLKKNRRSRGLFSNLLFF